MEREALWIISILGAGTLFGVFWKMKGGFGPFNLRVVGIVLIAILATLLGIVKDDQITAAIGILGAIAGYLFGSKGESGNTSSADASGATFGDNAKLAGRDINETISNIQAKVDNLQEVLRNSQSTLKVVASNLSNSKQHNRFSYLINTIYSRQLEETGRELNEVIRRWENGGWQLISLSSDFQGMDGIFLLFQKAEQPGEEKIQIFHGIRSEKIFPKDA